MNAAVTASVPPPSAFGSDGRPLAEEADAATLSAAWLEQLQRQLGESAAPLRCFVLLKPAPEAQELRLAAVRPAQASMTDLAHVLAQPPVQQHDLRMPWAAGLLVTVPLRWGGELRGLAGVQLATRDERAADAAEAALRWGAGWLLATLSRLTQGRERAALGQARGVLDLMAVAMAEPDFDGASLAAANKLAAHWGAAAVTVGWVDAQRVQVAARSHAAENDARSRLLSQAVAAMEEALDAGTSTQWCATTPPADAVPLPEHEAYARELRQNAAACALLCADGHAVGVLLLAREAALSDADREALDAQCMMLAPLLAQRRAADRGLWRHAREQAAARWQWLGSGSGLGWKLGAAAGLLLIVVAALVPAPLRITAPSVVEGEVQRAAVAPFQGYIREAHARAGDQVRSGQALATLEDKDLQLERVRWQAELDVAQHKEREAMAAGNRVELRLASAQSNQARAQLALVQEKLRRVQVAAPFDGVVVSGDLSQQLGSPVEQGKVLFELAPLNAWRVILKVDERDIAHVRPGQRGELVLAGLSGERKRFAVQRVTAVAVAEEGRNHFRVEAELLEHGARLRPGMEGVAKVDAGSDRALAVWTRRLVDWLRLTVWELSP